MHVSDPKTIHKLDDSLEIFIELRKAVILMVMWQRVMFIWQKDRD